MDAAAAGVEGGAAAGTRDWRDRHVSLGFFSEMVQPEFGVGRVLGGCMLVEKGNMKSVLRAESDLSSCSWRLRQGSCRCR